MCKTFVTIIGLEDNAFSFTIPAHNGMCSVAGSLVANHFAWNFYSGVSIAPFRVQWQTNEYINE